MKDKKPATFPLYINGQYVQTATLQEVNDPLEHNLGRKLCFAGPGDGEIIEAAIEGARMSFEQVRKGRFFPLHERLDFLRRLQLKLEEQSENLARLMTVEVGKPIKLSRLEITRCQTTLDWTRIEAARFFDRRGLPVGANAAWAGLQGWAQREGKGPLLAITPFNFPLNLALHKIAPALAAGCPVIFKPSHKAALTALTLVDLCHACGLPPGMISLINCDTDTTGRMVEDARIPLVSFTGSAKVGHELKKRGAGKDVFLELGGTGPSFVDRDADLQLAASKLANAAFSYAGQVCISSQNIHVHAEVYDEFRALITAETRAVSWGDPLNDEVLSGPVIDIAAAEKLEKRIDEALASGGEVVAEAATQPKLEPAALTNARYLRPRLIGGVSADHALATEELFGPAALLHRESSADGFFERAGAYPAKFQAAVFTRDVKLVERAARELDYGAVLINEANSLRLDPMPFGGNGEAGDAREGPAEALTAFTQAKAVIWRI